VDSEAAMLRSEEYGKIWMLLRMFMESEKPLTVIVIVWGGPGTGKTTVAKKLMNSAKYAWKNLEQIYLDPEAAGRCGLFGALQQARGLRGYSGSEILSFLKRGGCRLFIVIDNAETFLHAERRIPAILRISEAFPGESFFILMLFRSESIPVDITMVPPPVYPIYFRPYTFEEIRSMLKEFLKEHDGFSVDEKALDAVSRIAGFNGNAWLALAILKASLDFSENKHVNEKHVFRVSKKLLDNPLAYMHANLSDAHERIILKIVSESPQNMRFKHLFEEYSKMAEENGVKPLGYTQLWKKIRMLENKMLLDLKVNLNGGRAGIVRRKNLDWTTRS